MRAEGWLRRAASTRQAIRGALLYRSGKFLRKNVVRNGFFLLGTAVRLNPLTRPSRYGIEVERNLQYHDAAGVAHTLDVFRPTNRGDQLPVVFYVHGGGFTMLSKDTHWGMAMRFAQRGYLVFNINYRLAPKNRFPVPLEDVCAAFEWVVANAGRYGGDLDRLVFAGESAGANLVTSLTIMTTFERPEPYARRIYSLGIVPRAVVPACGIFQVSDTERFSRRRDLPAWVRSMLHDVNASYLGRAGSSPSDELALADPVLIFEGADQPRRAMPRFFLLVGTRDPLLDDTRRLERALAARKIECVARYYDGEVHAFHAFIWREQARECWSEKFAFLRAVIDAA